jgi:guanylate kinase
VFVPRRLTVLSGPSGVGKGTVVAALRRTYPQVWVSVSLTTRPPRPGETPGIEYDFVTRAEFTSLIERGELLEHAEFAGNLYGTPRQAVLDRLAADVPTLLEIELQGARQVRTVMPDAFLVFLAPPWSRRGWPARRSKWPPYRTSTRLWSTTMCTEQPPNW